MWHFLQGVKSGNDDITWISTSGPGKQLGLGDDDGVMLRILFSPGPSSEFAAVREAKRLVGNTKRPVPLTWLIPDHDEWTVDLDGMKVSQESLSSLEWLQGTFIRAPEFERGRIDLGGGSGRTFEAAFTFYVTRELVGKPISTVNGDVLKHEERWEVIRKLAAGGQGRVWIVRDKRKCMSRERIRELIQRSYRKLANAGDADRRQGADELIDAISNMQQADEPSNLGALKVLHGLEDARDPKTAEVRIRREMESMSRFKHPSLLRILDHNVDELWFVSQYHSGGTLEDRQDSFAGNVRAALTVLRPIVAGVAELHKSDVVHRDVKPENIYFSADGKPVVGDFGLLYFTDNSLTRVSETLDNVGSVVDGLRAPCSTAQAVVFQRPRLPELERARIVLRGTVHPTCKSPLGTVRCAKTKQLPPGCGSVPQRNRQALGNH